VFLHGDKITFPIGEWQYTGTYITGREDMFECSDVKTNTGIIFAVCNNVIRHIDDDKEEKEKRKGLYHD
jgi:hypothetical protein